MRNIFDTHCHYTDSAFNEDRHELLRSLPDKGVALAVQACVDLDDAVKIQVLANKYDYLYTSVGIHPESLPLETTLDDAYYLLKSYSSHPKCVAVGEIGLDYHYEGYNREQQIELFRMQLELARELDLPVIVHCRDAGQDCLEILREYKPRGVMHCFSGNAEMAKEVVKLGMYIGFTGAITFRRITKIVHVMEAVPLDKIVLETDCPYMAPIPFRGKRCESSMIYHSAVAAGNILGMCTEDLLWQTYRNGMALYNIRKEK